MKVFYTSELHSVKTGEQLLWLFTFSVATEKICTIFFSLSFLVSSKLFIYWLQSGLSNQIFAVDDDSCLLVACTNYCMKLRKNFCYYFQTFTRTLLINSWTDFRLLCICWIWIFVFRFLYFLKITNFKPSALQFFRFVVWTWLIET